MHTVASTYTHKHPPMLVAQPYDGYRKMPVPKRFIVKTKHNKRIIDSIGDKKKYAKLNINL